MKDYTVYSKYSTFIKQLDDDNLTDIVIRNISVDNLNAFKDKFYLELYKKCYTQNSVEMALRYNNKVSALIYSPCVDQYQKQFIVCVVFVDIATHKLLGQQCYKEPVNPLCITNLSVKDILAELKKFEALV